MKTKQFLALALLWAFLGTSLFPFASAQYSSSGGGGGDGDGGYGGCDDEYCSNGPGGGGSGGSPGGTYTSPSGTYNYSYTSPSGTYNYSYTSPSGTYNYSYTSPSGTYNIIWPGGTYTVMDGYPPVTTNTTSTTLPPKPPRTYYYCGDQKANNAQTQSQCRAANNARPEDPCVRNDALCSYNNTTNSTNTSINVVNLQTQCVRQSSRSSLYFDTMPELNDPKKLVAFNQTYANIICTNGGVVSAPFTINESAGTFRITCINATSIDTDGTRCTYSISNYKPPIDGGLDSITDNTTGISGVDGGINGTTDGSTVNNTTGISGVDNGGALNSGTGGGTYSISWSVIGEGTDISNVPVKLLYNGTELATTTDSTWRYSFSGLAVGAYQIKPENKDPYVFYSATAKITDSNIQGLDFSGINIKKVDDPNIAELLRRGTENPETDSGSFSSLNDWITRITTGEFTSGSGTGTGEYDEFGNLTNNGNNYHNIFSNNSLFQLLSSGYLPFSQSYSPIALSLITKFANQNAICGNGIAEEGETCDDGVNNGKTGQCSSDCLYLGEVRFAGYGLGSNTFGNNPQNALWGKNVAGIISTFQQAGNTVSSAVQWGIDIIENSLETIWDTLDSAQEWTKNKIIENTSPRTRKILKQTAVVAEEVAKYSVIWVTSLLGVAAASMQVMVYKSQWTSYTVQEGDTLDSIGNKFTMTERAMKARNGLLKKWGLRPWMKIKVRNRHFIEKDYLDQLKSVLKDGLEKRHYGKMAGKIDKMFAKK